MSKLFILDGHTPVPAELMKWAQRFEKADRHVAMTEHNGIKVSTVFLGLDHAFGGGPPQLFETMIFGGEHDEYQERCSTWEQAEEMHKVACKLAGVPHE